MQINDIQEYIRLEREKRQCAEGMTAKEIGDSIGLTRSTTTRFIASEIEAGRLKLNGRRLITASDGRQSYAPVYMLIPHEAT